MADEQPIEKVRAIAYYIDELLTRMDFVPEEAQPISKHKRKVSAWYDRGDLHVAVSVMWVGELPE